MQSLEVGQEKGRQCRNIDCCNAWDKAGPIMDIQGGSDKSGTLSKLHCCIKN
jgi:hypothetical protein